MLPDVSDDNRGNSGVTGSRPENSGPKKAA